MNRLTEIRAFHCEVEVRCSRQCSRCELVKVPKTAPSTFFHPKNQWRDSDKCLMVRSETTNAKSAFYKMKMFS